MANEVREKTQSAAASLFDRIASGDLGSPASGLDANDYMDMALASGYPRAMMMPSKALRASALRARVDQTLNVDSLLDDDTLLQRLQAARTPDETKTILKSVPGLKVNLDPEITIEFE